jgi:hypothetical protein
MRFEMSNYSLIEKSIISTIEEDLFFIVPSIVDMIKVVWNHKSIRRNLDFVSDLLVVPRLKVRARLSLLDQTITYA